MLNAESGIESDRERNTLYPTFLFCIGNSLFERFLPLAALGQNDNKGKVVRMTEGALS